MSVLRDTLLDVQTSVTSLGAAFAGVAAERAGTALIHRFSGGAQRGAGQIGLSFVARAAVASVAFAGATYLMPETSSNVFFSIVFFACNPSLIADARDFSNIVINTVLRETPSTPVTKKPPSHVGGGVGVGASPANCYSC